MTFFGSIETFFENLISGAEQDATAISAAYDKVDNMAGVVLGLGQVVVDAADPALAPAVTVAMTVLNSARAAAKSAVDNIANDVASATSTVANLTSAVVNLGVAAAPGITAIPNAIVAAATPPAA
jgi:phage-related protein